jgi:beta-glucosidase
VEISVDVVNVGDRPGTEVVQFYTRQRRSRVKQPLRSLRGFRRVRLQPGEQATVTITLSAAELACYDTGRERMVVETAHHTVLIGRSCLNITATVTLAVRGEEIENRDALRAPLRAATRDDEYGTALVDEQPERGDAVVARQGGAWLAFHGVDFGTGAGRATARVSAPAGGARLELRLDEPLSGPLAATLDVPATGDRHAWVDVTTSLTGAAGVHDLYLVLDTAQARVASVAFGRSVSSEGAW